LDSTDAETKTARFGRARLARALARLDLGGANMRALGPGSVSSFLKIILDVVHIALSIAIICTLLASLAALAINVSPWLASKVTILGVSDQAIVRRVIFAYLLMVALYIGAIMIIVIRLRRIFATLTAGDPFDPENVRRLRTIGLMLAALEIGRYPVAVGAAFIAPTEMIHANMGVNLTAWFAVLVVFVLAEVFREGARLRREAELTI
jgi:hypothetical protein